MPVIATVARSSDDRYAGMLHTLLVHCPLAIVPVPRAGPRSGADYRVLAGTLDIGSGWKRIDEQTGRPVVSLALAMPEFGPRRLYCHLVAAPASNEPDRFDLLWVPDD